MWARKKETIWRKKPLDEWIEKISFFLIVQSHYFELFYQFCRSAISRTWTRDPAGFWQVMPKILTQMWKKVAHCLHKRIDKPDASNSSNSITPKKTMKNYATDWPKTTNLPFVIWVDFSNKTCEFYMGDQHFTYHFRYRLDSIQLDIAWTWKIANL